MLNIQVKLEVKNGLYFINLTFNYEQIKYI